MTDRPEWNKPDSTAKWRGGKGSKFRPVDKKKYNDNWDAIFGKKDGKNVNTKNNEEFSK